MIKSAFRKYVRGVFKFILYNIIDLLIKRLIKGVAITPNTLLIIKLDGIGDYLLFRNFLEILKKDSKYRYYKIILVGNILWKNLSESLDKDYIERYIWIDREKFAKNLSYRYKKLKEICAFSYEVVISPTYTREFFYSDNIVKVVSAKEKIGSFGDVNNIEKWRKKISDKYYTKLITATNDIIFEFYRNKEFFENLLSRRLDIKKPYIEFDFKKICLNLNEYVLIFMGGKDKYKKWDIKKTARIAKYIKEKYLYDIVICGGKEDIADIKKFNKYFSYNYFNLVGKLSLVELLSVLKKCKINYL